MAHFRTRYLQEILGKITSFSPITGILGHRQVGKTTLLQHFSNHYVTLDDEDSFREAEGGAKKFLSHHEHKHTIIDECQLLPSLFPALKEKVRLNKKPGQYIISGSVRFTSRKAIQESLTGRIVNLELLPFTISEIRHLPLPQVAHMLLTETHLQAWVERHELAVKKTFPLMKEVDLYLKRGGLPGVFFVRENSLRETRIREQLTTLLDRDIRLVYPTTLPYSQILDFVSTLAQNEGSPIRYSELERKVKISEATQKKLLYALESIFLIRLIPIEGERRGHVCLFEDQGELSFLGQGLLPKHNQIESLIFRHLRTEWAYRLDANKPTFFQFNTRSGVRIPICLSNGKDHLAIIFIQDEMPDRAEKAASQAFFRRYQNSKTLFLSMSKKIQLIDDRSLVLPLSAIL